MRASSPFVVFAHENNRLCPRAGKLRRTGTWHLPTVGQLYYAMEYVLGADLKHIWRELAGPNYQGEASNLDHLVTCSRPAASFAKDV